MRAWLALWSIALAAWPLAARSQAPLEAPEIVVEGEREAAETRAEVFEDRPVETEIVREEEIQKLPVSNAADLARTLPGLRTQPRVQGEEAVVSIEGLPPEYTRVLVDGQRYSGAVGGVDDLRDFQLLNVERVEIQRGTQGIRRGSEGAGGVINLITRKPPERGGHARLDGALGTDDKVFGAGASELRVGPVGLTLSAAHDQIDGFDPRGDAVFPVAGGSQSQRTTDDLYGTATWSPLEKLELRSRLGWLREDESFVEPNPPDDADDPERRDFTRWVTTHGGRWSLSESTRVSSDFTFYHGSTDSAVGRPFTQDEGESKLEGQVEHFLETGRLGHALTLGWDLRSQTLDVDEGPPPSNVDDVDGVIGGDVDESFRIGAVFAEDEIALHERLSLLAGVRGEQHSEFGFDVSPQVALLGKPHESVRLRASWGFNHRNPTLKDLHQPPVPQLGGAYFLAGNPSLEPESSVSWRAGVEWLPRDWFAASAVGFWNEIDDAIRSIRDPRGVLVGRDVFVVPVDPNDPDCRQTPFPPDCPTTATTEDDTAELFRRENLDQLRTRGIETELRFQPHPRVELGLGYTYLQTQVVDSSFEDLDELPNSPHHVVDGRIVVRVPRTETSLALLGRWRGSALVETSGTGLASFTDQDERSDPSLILDLRVIQPIRSGLELYADFQNLTNEDAVDSYAIRGFAFFVGVRADFGWAGRAQP
jgi:outer membrane receptor for ferrienterochelin and colicins